MLNIQTKTISIVIGQDQPHLSKEQKAFNTLIKQIDAKRVRLAAWREIIPSYQRKYAKELAPLVKSSQDIEIELVHCLDRTSDQKGLTSTERRMLDDLISELAGRLAAERDDADLKSIYNKHSGSDFDAEETAAVEGMKFMFEDVLGVDLGDDFDMSSPEELLKRAQAQMLEQQTQHQADRQAQEERRAKRKKTAKQIAKESQQLAEEQQTSQSIRELYRKLASALHPDREPDPQERDRKTVLMQRINQAYDKKNLLLLLELQLELEHIDQATINNITAGRLKHYNKILKEQLNELEHEIFHTEDMFKTQFGISPFTQLSPSTIMRNLAADIVGVQHTIRELKDDLLVFQDIKKVKAWLKNMRRRPKMDYFDTPF
ncbi:J domain-containing protein [Candidatus Nitrotoga sp. 1052]|uniref:J domain-containing protein n=1 Tax=Candidatus Nitrotoga sp. 1052 TaxID=2886964 RepID=UPI001EF54ED2|nr:J domain-containing protein [Candidatus Nitrotoga sp. 1052]CAH1079410.1 Molecular chaperone DnaJ [Candidatus Nitrotoga sp. 1052]